MQELTVKDLQQIKKNVTELGEQVSHLEQTILTSDELSYSLCAAKYALWSSGVHLENQIRKHEQSE